MKFEMTRFIVLRGMAARVAEGANLGNCFQNPAWVDAVSLARHRFHEFVAVCAELETAPAYLFGGVHKRWGVPVFESMPMGGYGGWVSGVPLDNKTQRRLTSRWLRDTSWPVVSLVSEPGSDETLPTVQSMTRLIQPLAPRDFQTHRLDLGGNDAWLLQRMQPRVRSYLRKSDTSGFVFQIGGENLLPAFYDMYVRGSATWQQEVKSVFPVDFFSAMVKGGVADLWLISLRGRCIGAAIFLKGRGEVLYQASGTEKLGGPVAAMDALIWSAARHYRDSGFQSLNLGASEGLDSVRRFKEKFGAESISYRRAIYVVPGITMRITSFDKALRMV